MVLPTSSFAFQASELPDRLKQAFDTTLPGYWQIELDANDGSNRPKVWFLAVVQGRIVFSSSQRLSIASLVRTLQRYVPRLQNSQSKQALQQLETEFSSDRMAKFLAQVENTKLLSHDEVIQALRLKVLVDLDTYLFDYSGRAEFIPDPALHVNAPVRGSDLSSLLQDVAKRRERWKQLQEFIPSRSSTLTLRSEAVEGSSLTNDRKQNLQRLVKGGKSLDAIALSIGKDPLEVAKMLAGLVQQGYVSVVKSAADSQSEVFIVDDSPVLVQQFSHLVTSWGYRVRHSNDALTAVQTMMKTTPNVIFLDINMPGSSGFELIKQIRRQPLLASVPLVLLTAEKTVSNQWRAQWASCKFLAKPLKAEDTPAFKAELRALLQEITSGAKGSPA